MADVGEIVNERTKKSRGARNDCLYSRNIIIKPVRSTIFEKKN